jgi:hypothetical protein
MSFGLKISFGRLVKNTEVFIIKKINLMNRYSIALNRDLPEPFFEINIHKNYFKSVYGMETTIVKETENYIYGYYLINKQGLTKLSVA